MLGLEQVRVQIPKGEIHFRGPAGKFLDFLPNNSGLNEEYLYAHQPTLAKTISIYSTSPVPIGKLDDSPEVSNTFKVLNAPAIVVARKGYAGRMYVVDSGKFIVHEDAYAVKPKEEYVKHIDLAWFAGHYSAEFQGYRTSYWGIGDFPRERFSKMKVIIPTIKFQRKVAALYSRQNKILKRIERLKEAMYRQISQIINDFVT